MRRDNQKDADQEQLKVSLQNKTIELNTATEDGYIDSSGMVDAITGYYGKNTPTGRNILDLRANIGRGQEPPPTPPPTP